MRDVLFTAGQMKTTAVFMAPRQQRQGTITSPSFRIPANMLGEIQIVLVMQTADYENTANSLFADLYQEDVSAPGGWRLRASNRPGGWVGGRIDDPVDGLNPQPVLFALTVTPAELGKDFRVDVEIPTAFAVGFDVQRMEL